MAKVTVYVNDDQLEKLKQVKRYRRGGVSRAFQHFIEEMSPGGASSTYEYARKVMPVSAAVDRLRRQVAKAVAAGGPPADGGPVAAALTVLVYQEVLRRHPEAAEAVEKEFARFGLDEIVRLETEAIEDLLAPPLEEPEAPEDDDEDDDDSPAARIAMSLGAEFREVANALREAGVITGRPPRPPRPPRAPRPPRPPAAAPRGGRRRTEIEVGSDDDPREVLPVADFDTFKERHADWSADRDLTPEEMETITELLLARYEDTTDDRGKSEAAGDEEEG